MREMLKGKPVRLRQVRIQGWHSIWDRTISVPESGLLIFGSNGSGKTSLQDAIQYALFPDGRTIRFNSAVARSARDRSLLGYVLQQIEDGPKGEPRYLFENRTAYIALLFERAGQYMTFLVGIEGTRSGTGDILKASLQGLQDLRLLPLLNDDRQESSIPEIRQWLGRMRGHIYDTAEQYIGDLSNFHGSPHVQWPHLLKASIAFRDIVDATSFVRRFLEVKLIDHKTLLETFQEYQKLSDTAQKLEHWVELLDDAVGQPRMEGGRRLALERQPALVVYNHYHDLALTYRVGTLVLPAYIAQKEFEECLEAMLHVESEVERQSLEIAGIKIQQADIKAEHAALESQLRDRDIIQPIEAIEAQMAREREDVQQCQAAKTRIHAYVARLRPVGSALLSPGLKSLVADPGQGLSKLEILTPAGIHSVNEIITDADNVDLRRAGRFHRLTDEAEQAFSGLLIRLGQNSEKLRSEIRALEEERDSLRIGRPRYPAGVESARAMLKDRLGWAEARPLCEMLEIAEDQDLWRLAVEAELGWARFDFVVPELLFDHASRLYQQYRERGYTGANGQREPLFHVSFVDIGKIRQDRRNRATAGALSEAVIADSDDARDYLAYLLGRVAREVDVLRLRGHARAVTPDLMYYRGYKLSSHNARDLKLHIGQHARDIRLAEIGRDIQRLNEEVTELQRLGTDLSALHRMLREANQAYMSFEEDVRQARELPQRQERLASLLDQLRIFKENPESQALLRRRDDLSELLSFAEQQLNGASENLGRVKAMLEGLKKQADEHEAEIRAARKNADEGLRRLQDERTRALSLFETELGARAPNGESTVAGLKDFLRTCTRQVTENDDKAKSAGYAFARIAGQYRQDTGFKVESDVDHPEPLIHEYMRLKDTALPEQKKALAEKARDMRSSAVTNILNALAAQFHEVQRLLDEIRASTSRVPTRLGYFRLDVRPTEEWEHLYQLALRSLSVISYDQLEYASPEDPFLKGVEEFMSLLIANAADRDKLCDYRTYLEFEVKNRPLDGGEWSTFRGTKQGGSGGERQIPFYVMTFALLDYVYRHGARAHQFVGRLVLMDEVFHNMTDDNVRDVMLLARQLGLQIIMVTPGKLRTLAPLFGKTIQVAKDVVRPALPSRFVEYEQEQLPEDLLNFDEYEPSTELGEDGLLAMA
jgi:hypothetical protein